MFGADDQKNLIEDLRDVGVALFVLLGLARTGQRVQFDRARSQFIVDGRRINYRTIQNLLSKMGRVVKNDMRKATQDYFEERIDIDEWKDTMDRKITSGHWAAAGLVVGGLAVAAGSRYLERKINQEKRYADRFKSDILSGRSSEARSIFRAGSYSDAFRITAGVIEQGRAIDNGATRAYRILTANESCPGCLEYGEQWLPVDEMPEIGSLDCGPHCQCVIVYEYRSNE